MILEVQKSARALLDRAGVARGARAIVGCSGGPDSTVVADVAAAMAAEGRLGHITLLYVDHGLRGTIDHEIAVIGALVQQLSSRATVDLRVERVEVDRQRASLEAAARDARYRCFAQVATELVAGVVLLGHSSNDQAETVLMRILRGTGIAGLAGMPAHRGIYVRPLLDCSRIEIETYLAERGYESNQDPMNQDLDFFRVRVRKQVLPRLREENPRVDEALVRLAHAAREQREVLDYAAGQLIGAIDRGRPVVLDAKKLAAAPAAVAKRALLLAAGAITSSELSAGHLGAALELARGADAGSRQLDLPGFTLTREYGDLRMETPQMRQDAPVPIQISGPGGPYRVRRWRTGDRMRPTRLKGSSRKLSHLFVDQKVPKRVRVWARVVVREPDGVIVWAEHLGPAVDSRAEVRLTRPKAMASNKY